MAYYFASDIHMGLAYRGADERTQERAFVAWLDAIRGDCEGLFLVGDIFDFWFEHKRVAPKGFTRALGRLAEFCDAGIPVHFFVGNHDLWVRDYFEKEVGMTIHRAPELFELCGRRIFVAHGDGLGKKDFGFRMLSILFHSRTARWLFQRLVHPDFAMRFGLRWSHGSRHGRDGASHEFRAEGEPIVQFARRYNGDRAAAGRPPVDYFVCGHIHTPVTYPLDPANPRGPAVVILGEWLENPAVARLTPDGLALQHL